MNGYGQSPYQQPARPEVPNGKKNEQQENQNPRQQTDTIDQKQQSTQPPPLPNSSKPTDVGKSRPQGDATTIAPSTKAETQGPQSGSQATRTETKNKVSGPTADAKNRIAVPMVRPSAKTQSPSANTIAPKQTADSAQTKAQVVPQSQADVTSAATAAVAMAMANLTPFPTPQDIQNGPIKVTNYNENNNNEGSRGGRGGMRGSGFHPRGGRGSRRGGASGRDPNVPDPHSVAEESKPFDLSKAVLNRDEIKSPIATDGVSTDFPATENGDANGATTPTTAYNKKSSFFDNFADETTVVVDQPKLTSYQQRGKEMDLNQETFGMRGLPRGGRGGMRGGFHRGGHHQGHRGGAYAQGNGYGGARGRGGARGGSVNGQEGHRGRGRGRGGADGANTSTINGNGDSSTSVLTGVVA